MRDSASRTPLTHSVHGDGSRGCVPGSCPSYMSISTPGAAHHAWTTASSHVSLHAATRGPGPPFLSLEFSVSTCLPDLQLFYE